MQFDILPLKSHIFQHAWQTHSEVRVHNLDFFQRHLTGCTRKHFCVILNRHFSQLVFLMYTCMKVENTEVLTEVFVFTARTRENNSLQFL